MNSLLQVAVFAIYVANTLAFQSSRFNMKLDMNIDKTSNRNMMKMSTAEKKRVVIVGATGYIGKFVVKESIRRGYDTIAVVREGSAPKDDFFKDCFVVEGDVTNEDDLFASAFQYRKTDVVISCLASRSGTKSDSYAIDYQATLNTLNAARKAKVEHFVLLSAFCVKKPLLQFQNAKLQFENALVEASKSGDIKYSIVRPTAFFKSVSGQVELLQQGWPFVMFGDGTMCKCNPIAESDLATYMINCIEEPDKYVHDLYLYEYILDRYRYFCIDVYT
jgi:divinyl chlorophyllide a 8-vinyl-reductase